jgi:hypothetical protein
MNHVLPEAMIAASADQVCCQLNGQAVILNLKTGSYYGLDEVGSRVWALIQQPKSWTDLRNVLLSEFDVEPGICERDLSDLIDGLSGFGLVRIQP